MSPGILRTTAYTKGLCDSVSFNEEEREVGEASAPAYRRYHFPPFIFVTRISEIKCVVAFT